MADTSRRSTPRKGHRFVEGRTFIDKAAIERVVAVIRTWPNAPFTWALLVDDLEQRERKAGHGSGWTSQGLRQHKPILDAYHARKDDFSIASKGKKKKPRDPALVVQTRLVKALRDELDDTKKRLAEYEMRFVTILRNAAKRGISQQQLEAPLPHIDRSAI